MTNLEYWQKRNEAMFLAGEKDTLQVVKELKKVYQDCYKNLENQINIFYGKYASANNMTILEAKTLLNKNELKEFKTYIKEMQDLAKSDSLSKDYIQQLNVLRAKSRVSRLNELQIKMQGEIEQLSKTAEDKLKDNLEQTYEDGYYKTLYTHDKYMGVAGSFTSLNKEAIEKAVKTKYLDTNYAVSLYKNKENLLQILNNEIPRGLALGQNPAKLAKIVSKKLDTNYNSVVRLARTEYNLILNDGSIAGYKEAGIEKYQLLATLDSRTSDICQEMDGKIFKLSEKEVGVTFPPFHPNCRTTTIPYFEPDEFDAESTRIARDSDGNTYKVPANLTYKQWQEGLSKQKNGNIAYTG